jgi:uroporphyrinogen III methyltransferase/synthase
MSSARRTNMMKRMLLAAAAVATLGGEPVHLPAVRIAPPGDWAALDDAIGEAATFDWIVFASVNGVRSFAARLRAAGRDARLLGTARLAAIGLDTRPARPRCA